MKYRIIENRYRDIDSTREPDKYLCSIVQRKRFFIWQNIKGRDGNSVIFKYREDAENFIKARIYGYSKVVEVFDSKKGIDAPKGA